MKNNPQCDAVRMALNQVEAIVCTVEPDEGVILISDDSPTVWDDKSQCRRYVYEHFSLLGNALISLHKTLKIAVSERDSLRAEVERLTKESTELLNEIEKHQQEANEWRWNYVEFEKESQSRIARLKSELAGAKGEVEWLHVAVLGGFADLGLCTPEEGFLKARHCLPRCFEDVQRDGAKAMNTVHEMSAEIQRLKSQSRWIPVTERMPTEAVAECGAPQPAVPGPMPIMCVEEFASLIEPGKPEHKPWPAGWPKTEHDMLVGPCSCGAWHAEGELSEPSPRTDRYRSGPDGVDVRTYEPRVGDVVRRWKATNHVALTAGDECDVAEISKEYPDQLKVEGKACGWLWAMKAFDLIAPAKTAKES